MNAPGRVGSPRLREGARRVALAAPAAVLIASVVATLVYVLPRASRNPLLETTLWSLLVVVAFAGWGSLVRLGVARAERVDLGLRVVWGASALCALGGLLAAFSAMTRSAAFLAVEVGVVLAVASLVVERSAVRIRARTMARVALREPRLAVLTALVAAFLALHYLAGVSETHTNPYDDDIAYLSFVKKMLDTGAVLEPFSLRRLSALGGQTFFLELVALRAAPSQAHTFDRSICVLMIVLLVTGYRAQARRVPWVVALAVVVLLLVLPNVSINTASYYSGIAFFLGLFRTVVWLDQRKRSPWRNALPVALVGAAVCTLRQNYIAVPPVVLGATYVSRLLASREPFRVRLRTHLTEPALAAAFAAAALVPWFVMAWQSNRTFFYPVMLGTSNPAVQFQSSSTTALGEIYLQVWTLLDGLPLKTIGIFVLAAALLREPHPRRPLWSYVIGATAGFVALVHGLTQGDAGNIGRYAAGFLVVIPLAVLLVSTTPRFAPQLGRQHVAAGLAMVGLLGALTESRVDLAKFYARATHNIDQLAHNFPRSSSTDPPEVALYQRLQESVPAGARLAVLLDEPYNLSFSRNPIWNLDMPGYSSLPPGIPYFVGSERVEEYFRALGVRYLAYVRVGYSRYHYRREYWAQEVSNEQEVWRIHAPYVLDFLDNLTAIEARHRRAFDERGLVVIDLEAPR